MMRLLICLLAAASASSVYASRHILFLITRRHDHLGRRVQKFTPEATHTYFYAGWQLIKETRHPAASQSGSDAARRRISLGEDAAGSRVARGFRRSATQQGRAWSS